MFSVQVALLPFKGHEILSDGCGNLGINRAFNLIDYSHSKHRRIFS